ncbi:MAG: phosphoglycerate kinase [Flavobacteriales bacterium]|nr:phosphoglycerate kinase [Flavobacteriales bacterium]
MKTVLDFNFLNKTALIRVDFNVPLDANQNVLDNTRILSAKPTILKIINDGGSCVLMSHLGRPKGWDLKYSLKHIFREVENTLGRKVIFIPDCTGEETLKVLRSLKPGEIVLMENLRFYDEEINGCEKFAKRLSLCGDIYVNDAFGAAHRKHASTSVIADFFPNKKCSGLLLNKEITAIEKVLNTGERPIVAILGGAKVSSKITIINNIFKKVDAIILGGGMAYTFIKAQGGEIGDSICEDDKIDLALELIERAKENNVDLYLPTDVVAADSFSNEANKKELQIFNISKGWQGLDIGPASIKAFSKVIINAKTILWNGPMGVFEMPNFSNGTKAIGEAIKISTQNGAYSLVGGGDSVSAVKEFGLDKDVSYVSTGGGAMLESLEGKTLPGIAAL